MPEVGKKKQSVRHDRVSIIDAQCQQEFGIHCLLLQSLNNKLEKKIVTKFTALVNQLCKLPRIGDSLGYETL